MLTLKKTMLVALALSTSVVFSGTMGPVCSAVNVTVPCPTSGWSFAGKALYAQATLNGHDGAMSRTLTNHNNGLVATNGLNLPYAWGFFLEASHHFNTGNDINLNWYEVNRGSSKVLANSIPDGLTPVGVQTANTFAGGYVQLNPNWNAVNLEVGQHVDFGDGKNIRFHAGAQYARIETHSTLIMSGQSTSTAFPFTTTVIAKPTYNGFGPRLGADMMYGLSHGINLYANAATALLAGTTKYTNSYNKVDQRQNVTTTLAQFSTIGSSPMIVPELDAKLGATYTYAMAQGDVMVDAGWMWVNYFNAQQTSVDGLSPVNQDFAVQGPFVGLKWMGNAM